VIVLTGMLDQCEPGALIGADLILEKPPEVSCLLQAISDLLHEPPDDRLRRLNNIPTIDDKVSGSRFRRLAPARVAPTHKAPPRTASEAQRAPF
jgi:hypothetical protein